MLEYFIISWELLRLLNGFFWALLAAFVLSDTVGGVGLASRFLIVVLSALLCVGVELSLRFIASGGGTGCYGVVLDCFT
jgi:hypothetical protein